MIALGDAVEQANPLQVRRRHAERESIADPLVEAVVGSLLEEDRQLVVAAEVEVVPELVVDRHEVLFRRLDAHLDAQVVAPGHVPRAGVTDDLAVARPDEEAPLPEGRRQRVETEGREEALAELHHLLR